MKIVFVNPPLYGLPTPPYGLVLLGTIARGQGFDVRIIDFNLWVEFDLPKMIEAVLADRPDAVAFTCWGNATPFCLEVARSIRDLEPGVWLLAGGPMIRPGWSEFGGLAGVFDVLVEGEGEGVLVPILAAIRAGKPVRERGKPGRLLRAQAPDLAALPLPDWSLLDSLDPYRDERHGLRLPIQASRGCAYNCSFCSVREFWGNVRSRTPEAVAAEIKADLVNYRADMILFYDDNFTGNRRWVESLLATFRSSLPRFPWVASTRIDLVPPALADALADAGVVNLFFGIESASEEVRKVYRKSFRVDVLEMLEGISKAGIAPEVSLIFGSPADGPEVMAANLGFIDDCARSGVSYVHTHVLFPIPDTGIARTHAGSIILNPYPRVTQPSLAETPDSYFDFMEAHKELCLDFWMFSPRSMTLDGFFDGFFEALLKKRQFAGGIPMYASTASPGERT